MSGPDKPRERVTADAAAQLMADAGFTGDLAATLRRFPHARSRAHAEDLKAVIDAPEPHWTETSTPDALAALEAVRAANPLIREARAFAAARAKVDEA